jgi:hypothetical protein
MSYVTTHGQSASLSWNKAPIWGLRPDFYYRPTVAGLLMWGALSDERTGVSLQLLLALASAVILGSESLGTRDRILLSQIWDFPFRRLLRLAGHGGGIRPRTRVCSWLSKFTLLSSSSWISERTPRIVQLPCCHAKRFSRCYENTCLASRWLAMDAVVVIQLPQIIRYLGIASCWLAMDPGCPALSW